MKPVNKKNFVSMLSEDLPVLCFFYEKNEDNPNKQIKEIKDVVIKIEKQLPKLKTFEFVRNMTEDDEYFCDMMEIAKYPILIIYKDGCFSRFKSKDFSEKEILKFLGNTKIYQEKEEKANTVSVDLY